MSTPGRRQAEALANRLGSPLLAAGATTLISSPYLRCIQTLGPLAKVLGGTVETDESLSEGRSFVGVLELMEMLAEDSVICSHGDVIPETIAALERRGCEFTSPPDWRKASVWVLERDAAGEFVRAESWPPPEIS